MRKPKVSAKLIAHDHMSSNKLNFLVLRTSIQIGNVINEMIYNWSLHSDEKDFGMSRFHIINPFSLASHFG
jgi:hypothetical protein